MFNKFLCALLARHCRYGRWGRITVIIACGLIQRRSFAGLRMLVVMMMLMLLSLIWWRYGGRSACDGCWQRRWNDSHNDRFPVLVVIWHLCDLCDADYSDAEYAKSDESRCDTRGRELRIFLDMYFFILWLKVILRFKLLGDKRGAHSI